MNITNLPDDMLLIIIDEFNSDIFQVSVVNKEFNKLSQQRLDAEKERSLAKYEFIVGKCKRGIDIRWVHNAFHGVTSVEECEFIKEIHTKKVGLRLFLKQVRYTINHTYQVAAETWTKYLSTYFAPTSFVPL